jgi:integrase
MAEGFEMVTGKLNAAKVKTASAGMHGDGGGLWLQVGPGRSWAFRFTLNGKPRQMGLGPVADVSLAAARELARQARIKVKDGIDPIEEREAGRQVEAVAKASAVPFETAAIRYIEAHAAGWRNAKHAAQWTATLRTYAFPEIGAVAVADVDTAGVLAVLEPLWKAGKIETGVRVRGRIEAVLDYASARGWRQKGFNPAAWKGHLSHTLAAPTKVRKVVHHPALPWKELPEFWPLLCERQGIAAMALRFGIMTAARSGEIRGARWSEIDRAEATWNIAADRMKGGRPHRVPLQMAALTILEQVAQLPDTGPGDLVFPGMKTSVALSDMSVTAVLRRMGRGDLTVHGFRSTFRDWAAETGQPADIAEAALAHVVGDKTVAAYQRGDLLDRRRKLMEAWAAFCCPATVAAGDATTDPPIAKAAA